MHLRRIGACSRPTKSLCRTLHYLKTQWSPAWQRAVKTYSHAKSASRCYSQRRFRCPALNSKLFNDSTDVYIASVTTSGAHGKSFDEGSRVRDTSGIPSGSPSPCWTNTAVHPQVYYHFGTTPGQDNQYESTRRAIVCTITIIAFPEHAMSD
jgi:hypothetical protein